MMSIKMHSTESRFVTGPSNVLFAGVYVYTSQPGNFAGCCSEGVKSASIPPVSIEKNTWWSYRKQMANIRYCAKAGFRAQRGALYRLP